jgi:hypothetical protein
MEKKMPTHRPACIVHTAPDPDALLVHSNGIGETGGILEVRCETPNHPRFEVWFRGKNPSDSTPDAVFKGSMDAPVIIPLNEEGTFEYCIQHYRKDGEPSKLSGPIAFNIRKCPACL